MYFLNFSNLTSKGNNSFVVGDNSVKSYYDYKADNDINNSNENSYNEVVSSLSLDKNSDFAFSSSESHSASLEGVFALSSESHQASLDDVFPPSSEVAYGDAFESGLSFAQKQSVPLNTIFGTEGADIISGGEGNDFIATFGGNDVIHGSAGIDMIQCGDGLDTVMFELMRAGVETTVGGELEVSVRSELGISTLEGVERVVLKDATLALDLDGAAGQAYRLYQVALGDADDGAALGQSIVALDEGLSLHDLASTLMASAKFESFYGVGLTNAEFVADLYENGLQRVANPAEIDGWVSRLENEGYDRSDVLLGFSESTEVRALVADAVDDGIWFT